jgi:hypothetical protein
MKALSLFPRIPSLLSFKEVGLQLSQLLDKQEFHQLKLQEIFCILPPNFASLFAYLLISQLRRPSLLSEKSCLKMFLIMRKLNF